MTVLARRSELVRLRVAGALLTRDECVIGIDNPNGYSFAPKDARIAIGGDRCRGVTPRGA